MITIPIKGIDAQEQDNAYDGPLLMAPSMCDIFSKRNTSTGNLLTKLQVLYAKMRRNLRPNTEERGRGI